MNRTPTTWYLQQIDVFSDLNAQELAHVDSCFVHKSHKEKTELHNIDQKETIFLLKKGVIELYSITETGKKSIIDILGPGSIFGNVPHHNDFVLEAAVKKDCILCSMPMHEFFEMISSYPQAASKLLKALYAYTTNQQEWISSLATESVTQRLLRFFRKFSVEYTQQHNISFTHEDLAQMIGTSRQTVTTLLNSLVKDGKLEKVGKHYRLLT